MQVIPVLDVMGGLVVRGVAGRRQHYRPIQSPLVASSDPLAVAAAFRDHFGLTTLYLADLDAILGATPAWSLIEQLSGKGFRLWVDAGVRDLARADFLAWNHVEGVVLGLESLPGPALLEAVCNKLGAKTIFSLDLRDGRPLGDLSSWRHRDAWSIACGAVALGVQRILVLDLARVGVNDGFGTDELCARLKEEFPAIEVYAGGGVRGMDDLRRMAACGVTAAIVASALHDARLTRREVEAVSTEPLTS